MSNYQNGLIYEIKCNKTELVYVGSTVDLPLRMNKHTSAHKVWKEGKVSEPDCRSTMVLELNDFSSSIIEVYPCNTKKELQMREKVYILAYKELMGELCVNHNIPCRTHAEYYAANRDKILAHTKAYALAHKAEKSAYNTMYYHQDAQKQRDRVKKYREANSELVHAKKAERIECEYCGDMVQRQGKARHQKRRDCWSKACDNMNMMDV